jgi:hypothetical protein
MPAVVPDCHIAGVTDLDAAAQRDGPLPRELIVVLAVAGLLVSVLAQRQFASIIGPVLLVLILVIGVHPMTGILRPLRCTAVAGGDRHGARAGGRDPGPRGSVGAVRHPVVRRAAEAMRSISTPDQLVYLDPRTGSWISP